MTTRHQRIYIDPRFDTPEIRRMVKQFHPDAQIMGKCPRPCKTELTPIGEQYVIPSCEKRERSRGRQLNLWDRQE